jgi:16S rRNA G1207 methylase RsmC
VTRPDWGPEQREISDQELRCAARGLARREGGDIVLVINRQLPLWEELTPAGSTRGAIVATEDYHLYRLRYSLLGPTAQAAQCPG